MKQKTPLLAIYKGTKPGTPASWLFLVVGARILQKVRTKYQLA
jgi:hypothetical protein